MASSAFERAVMESLLRCVQALQRHDRFVIIGLLLSLFPLPPACFAGWLLSLMHRRFLRTGRLPASEAEWVHWSTWPSSINPILAIGIMVWFSHNVSAHAMHWHYLFSSLT